MNQDWPQLWDRDDTIWRVTRDTLHRYSKVVGAVRRALAPAHPLWWHSALTVYPRGLTTGPVAVTLENGGKAELELRFDLEAHRLEVAAGAGARAFDLAAGRSASELGDGVLEALADFEVATGGQGAIEKERYADDTPSRYHRPTAERYRLAIYRIDSLYRRAAADLATAGQPGDTGPPHLWPHHFDLSFEWFGRRRVPPEEEGADEARAQIGYGFSPGDAGHPKPYFYCNPWPFEDAFTAAELPPGASWHREGWQGALLPYETVRDAGGEGGEKGDALVVETVRRVHEIAAAALNRPAQRNGK